VTRPAAFFAELQRASGGTIPFERYMAEALHHPEFGYYTRRIREVGSRGDFSTLATLDDSLAGVVAARIRRARPRHVIEIGAGSGALSAAVRKRLGLWRRPAWHIVEVSHPLRLAQQALLGRSVRWHADPAAALAATGGEAFLFSNELVDAFPCRVLERSASGWSEIHVRLDPATGQMNEVPVPVEAPATSAFGTTHPVGRRIEVHTSYRDWLESWRDGWRAGEMLTIDYGDTMPPTRRTRLSGTLRGYFLHGRLEGAEVLQAPGRIDITADVNFTDLRQWGEALGLHTTLETTLDTLMPSAPPRILEAAGAFRVLEQSTG
jgi:SAM-dependent MidA family methyltransferase